MSPAALLKAALVATALLPSVNAQTTRCPAIVINHETAGDPIHPKEIVPGCLISVEFQSANEELYLQLPRADIHSTLITEWEMEEPKTLFLFDWEQTPSTHMQGAHYMWYFAEAVSAGDRTFRQGEHVRVGNRVAETDCYHCAGNGCAGPPTQDSRTGLLYITLSNQLAATNAYSGEVRFVLSPPRMHITSESIEALRSLWTSCCQRNYYRRDESNMLAMGFDPQEWVDQHGSDTDTVPYCYWNPLGANEAQHIPGNPGEVRDWSDVTDQSCEDLNHVRCDEGGNIAELSLSGLGLKCNQIPDLPALSRIKTFHAMANQISGTVPAVFTESDTMQEFKMSHNFLTGTVPCFASPRLEALEIDFNMLSGEIPACLLGKPSMEQLDLSNNFLGGELPVRWGVPVSETSNLVSLEIRNAKLRGVLPVDMTALPRIAVIDLSQNHLTGPIPESMLRDAHSLYKLALSHNELSGTLPQVGSEMRQLNVLNLDNNHIYGPVAGQFDYMRQYQHDEIVSSISLQSNSFSGPLPRAIAALTLGEPYIHDFDISDNHFYCEKSTSTWPAWAMRLDSKATIGTCEPVPRIDRIEPAVMAVGEPITVYGSGFMATDDFRCKFGNVVSDALFDSTVQARCIVPYMPGVSPGQTVELTMANYGEDWSGPELLSDFSPTSFTLSTSETCSGHGIAQADGKCVCDSDASGQWSGQHCDEKSTNPFLKALVGLLSVMTIGFGIFIWVLISKEKKGDPLFASLLEGADDGMGGNGRDGFAMQGMTVEGAEPHMPPPNDGAVTQL